MPSYDAERFQPPAPVVYVTLRNREAGLEVGGVPMLLDTGADVTLVPSGHVKELGEGVISDKYYELIGFDGNTTLAQVASLEVTFLTRNFRGRFLLIEQEWGIIGRNVLNAVPLLLDGPRLTWDEVRR